MSVEFLRDLAQAHKGWEEEKGLLAAADEIERLRHALNVTDGQSRECLGDDDGVPCVSHLAYMDCEQEIKRLREDYDGYRKRSQEENDALRSGLLKAEQRIEEFEHMLRGQTFTVKCEGRHITDAQIDAAWKFVNECGPRVRAPILHALNVFFGIVRCEGCVGKGKWNIDTNCGATGQYLGKTPYVCPDCDGHGWVKKGGGDGMDND